MSGIECPVCGKIRKIEIMSTPIGWINPPCYNCHDPGWICPHDSGDPFMGKKQVEHSHETVGELDGEPGQPMDHLATHHDFVDPDGDFKRSRRYHQEVHAWLASTTGSEVSI